MTRAKVSAGVVVHRVRSGQREVLLVHPGGPLWARRDLGAWSIPKGEMSDGDDALAVARRELEEETGCVVEGPFTPLPPIRQAGGKTVVAFLADGDCDVSRVRSNTFTMEWPPKSGEQVEFPEVDRAAWFPLPEARRRILASQLPLLDALGKPSRV